MPTSTEKFINQPKSNPPTKPTTITLSEYETLGHTDSADEKICEEEFKEIRDYVIRHSQRGEWLMRIGHNYLKAQNYVGIIQTRRGSTIEILPKIDLSGGNNDERTKDIFLKMLSCLGDFPFREFGDADIRARRNFPLLEVFITIFLKDLLKLTHHGLARSYNEIEENRYFLRGKLLLTEQLRHNFVHKERFYVRYEEFSANRPINRLLKSTLLLLNRLSRSTTNLSHIHQARFYFDEVPESHNIDADLTAAHIDRTMPLYTRLFPWMRLFLKGISPASYQGKSPSIALLFPMERVFEDYVAHQLRRELRRTENWQIRTQERPHCLIKENPDGNPEFQLRPDIVIRNQKNKKCLILDTKWKRLDEADKKNHYFISQGDLYQLYAYGHKYRANENENPDTEKADTELYLLYPQNENFKEPLKFFYDKDKELPLTVFPVDLENDCTNLLAYLTKNPCANIMLCTEQHPPAA